MNTMSDAPHSLLQAAISSTNEGIVITEAADDCPIIYVNAAFEKLTGYGRDEILGKNCRFLQQGDNDQPERETLQNAIANKTSCRVLLKNYKKDGTLFWNELSLSPITSEAGKTTHFVGVQKDITAEKNYQMEIKHLSEHDQLTGMHNRHGFYKAAEKLYQQAQNDKHAVCVAVIDVNNFKQINDALGHQTGDKLLASYAKKLRAHLRSSDVLARFGGDEFVLLASIISHDDKHSLIQKIMDAQDSMQENLAQEDYHFSVSAGIHCADNLDINKLDELISLADQAMYEEKRSGNC